MAYSVPPFWKTIIIMSLPSLTISHISMVYGHPILMTSLQGPVNPSYLVLCKPLLLYHIYIPLSDPDLCEDYDWIPYCNYKLYSNYIKCYYVSYPDACISFSSYYYHILFILIWIVYSNYIGTVLYHPYQVTYYLCSFPIFYSFALKMVNS